MHEGRSGGRTTGSGPLVLRTKVRSLAEACPAGRRLAIDVRDLDRAELGQRCGDPSRRTHDDPRVSLLQQLGAANVVRVRQATQSRSPIRSWPGQLSLNAAFVCATRAKQV